MYFGVFAYLAQSLRYTKNFILGGKRRLRYQLHACGKIFRMPRSLPMVAYLTLNKNSLKSTGSYIDSKT